MDSPLIRTVEAKHLRIAGWMKDVLEAQKEGLTGHLQEFWKSVRKNSGWLGGRGESWERGPYFLDGYLPLAYLLKDRAMMEKADEWVEWTLQSQRPDGFFGPKSHEDWWPRMVMLKALMTYHGFTGDPRILPFMERYFRHQLQALPQRPLANWGKARAGENILSCLYLYDRTGEPFLLDLVCLLSEQGAGWGAFFSDLPLKGPTKQYYPWRVFLRQGFKCINDIRYIQSHTVNVAMALKEEALVRFAQGEKELPESLFSGLRDLFQHHGQAGGIWSGDEHLSGASPSQGSELCSVAEFIYSLEVLLGLKDEVSLADRLEKAAYNAFAAAISPDFKTHQYLQQANQIACSVNPFRGLKYVAGGEWYNNGADANLFGLAPNFGCCTANMHQGWPKFALSLWMREADVFIPSVYAPSVLDVRLQGGTRVRIEERTDYPFSPKVAFHVFPGFPARFSLKFRVPQWAFGAKLFVNGEEQPLNPPGRYTLIERVWRQGDKALLMLPMAITPSFGPMSSVSLEKGPLVMALKVEEKERALKRRSLLRSPKARRLGFRDYAYLPRSPWNYALALRDGFPEIRDEAERQVSGSPFGPVPPLYAKVRARRVPLWKKTRAGSAQTPPPGPIKPPEGPEEWVTLVPYASAKLRISAFPWFSCRPQDGSEL